MTQQLLATLVLVGVLLIRRGTPRFRMRRVRG